MFGKGKKEKDVLKMVESLSAEEKQDLIEALMPQENQAQEQPQEQPQQEIKNETSTNEQEKVVEVAKTTDDTNQDVSNNENPIQQEQQDEGGNGISIDDVMLKSEAQKYFESFEAKLNSIMKENQDLKNQKAELEAQNKEYKDKYENNAFGNYNDKSTNDNNKSNNYESASDYFSKFFNK